MVKKIFSSEEFRIKQTETHSIIVTAKCNTLKITR